MSKQKKNITEFRSYLLPVDFPVLLLSGDNWRISDRPRENLHFHNCLEIGFCHEGSGILQIRSHNHPFCAGDITFIARNIPHTTWSSKGNPSLWSYFMVDIGELFESFPPPLTLQINPLLDSLNTAGILHSSDHPELSFYVQRLISEAAEKNEHHQLYIRSLFLPVIIEFSRAFRSLEKQSSGSGSEAPEAQRTLVILPALEYIKLNYMTQFPMDSLADLCGLSPTHFRRVFYHTMGASPLEYLNTLRINQACRLLRSTEDSVLNISEAVGFHSVSSFNRLFTRLLATSPREYRRTSYNPSESGNRILKYNGWLQPEE